jgi:hypothetical protein
MPRQFIGRRNQPRRGVVAIFVAISLVALLGMTAVSVDGGLLYLRLRDSRATADASAMAAACILYKNYPTDNGTDPKNEAQKAALAVAAQNGFSNDGVESTVTVNIPPSSGPYQGLAGYVEVLVQYNVPRGFSRVFGGGTIPVRARAVARGAWIYPNAGVLILDYSSKASLNTQGNGAFTEIGGPVIINSNNPSAVVTTGNAQMTSPTYLVTGGVKLGGNGGLQTAPKANQIFLGTHPTPDPLAYLPEPSVPPNGTMATSSLGMGNTLYTLTPGYYTNLPTFNTGDQVVLKQASANNAGGIFYIDGGGFKSTGASITMDPNTTGGVMIYNKPASTADSEKIQITGNASGTVNLSPLASGPYAGMMLWQERSSTVPVLVEGNGSFNVAGTFYAAGAMLNINGNGQTSTGTSTGSYVDSSGNTVQGGSKIGSQYISADLSLGGNGNISIKYAGPDLARTRIITLVE